MILGHERQINYLNKVLRRGKLAHAYLFYGPEHVGKFTAAQYFIEKLPCLHPIILDTENSLVSKKERRKDIPIEDIRELKRLFALAPEGNKWRAAIINQAEKMSSEAADALLKLLEEPGEQTLFLLVTSSLELLPPTIVSRVQLIRFSLVPEKIMAGFLKDEVKNIEMQREILTLAAGRPGVMFYLINNEEQFQKEKKFLRELALILEKKDIPEAFRMSEKIAAVEGERTKMIEYVIRILRANLLKNLSSESTDLLLRKLKNIQQAAAFLETTNVNARLALDTILLEALTT